jgi:DUF4097 and DUF4098 domain-containing protein YvlB
MQKKAWLAGLACMLGAAASAPADEWSHRYALKGRPELHLRTDDGSIRVEASDGAQIEALVTTEGWRIEAGEVTVTESQTGDQVSIDVRVPQRNYGGFGAHRSVKLVVRVPREADLDIRTGDGGVDVEPISGKVTITTGDGHITAQGLRGDIRLHTNDGAIRAEGLEGRLKADTGDGHMSIQGRFDALDLRTGDGRIDAEVARGSKVTEAWSLRSGDGGITLRVPDDLGADLEAHTGDGHIVLDSPVTVSGTIRPSDVRGKLGAGGPPLRMQTGDGSIRVQRL